MLAQRIRLSTATAAGIEHDALSMSRFEFETCELSGLVDQVCEVNTIPNPLYSIVAVGAI